MLNGFLIIDKEKGLTSAQVLNRVKFLLKKEDKEAKIGHLGTLDPDGEGVLPAAIGRAARLFGYLTQKEKVYYTEFRFGELTDTLDTTGTVLKTSKVYPSICELQSKLSLFIGKIMQIPPQISAKNYGGVKSYKLARQGIEVPLEPKEIEIYEISDVKQTDTCNFSMIVRCSGGTYIRALIRDIASALGSYASMSYIKRLRSGCFDIKDAKKLSDISSVSGSLLPMEYALGDYPRLEMTPAEVKFVKDGRTLVLEEKDGLYAAYSEGVLTGIAEISKSACRMKTWLL